MKLSKIYPTLCSHTKSTLVFYSECDNHVQSELRLNYLKFTPSD